MINELGIHDNFFDLGGDSLRATRVVVRLLKELKIEVPLRILFQEPTIGELAAKIEAGQGKLEDPELALLLDRIETLTDDELRQWLQTAPAA